MMELSRDLPVTLIIKAPNQRMADQTIDCMLGWTIQKLKKHLEIVYPTKPKHNEQKLVYSGRLLQDHLTLKEILCQYDSSLSNKHTVHLVYSPVIYSNSSSSTTCSSQNSPKATVSIGSSSSANHSSESINIDKTEDLPYRSLSHLTEPSASPEADSAHNGHTMYQRGVHEETVSYTPEQYAWILQQQQMYSHYMMHYILYYQSLCTPGLSFNHLMPPSSTQQQQHVVGNSHPQQHAHEDAAVNNGLHGAEHPNVRMNAQGGVEEEDDDEGEPRDWLHHMYFFMRILTFMGILFFYSNLTRFLIVFAGSFAIYILQKLRTYMQRVQQEQDDERRQQEQDVRIDEAQPLQSHTGRDEQPAVENGGRRLARILIFICNTIQTFFTSMLPTPPELLEPN